MRTLFETHRTLKNNFIEYHKEHPDTSFRNFLTDVLKYSEEETNEIVKENKRILYKNKGK